jgi:hypothetical protein
MAARPAQFDEHLVFGRVRDAMGVPKECAPRPAAAAAAAAATSDRVQL